MTDQDSHTGPHPHHKRDSYVLPRSNHTTAPQGHGGDQSAADLIRQKLDKIYASEPDALQEEQQAETVYPRSKHQQFMHDLNHSGKTLVQIQTEWHAYYMALDDKEKHAVWQEFYANNQTPQPGSPQMPPASSHHTNHTEKSAAHAAPVLPKTPEPRSASQMQHDSKHKPRKRGKPTVKQHFHSLLFGLSVGTVTLLIFLFGFFNEIIIAPFVQPSRTASATPLIVSSDTIAPTDQAQVVIPKINVQIPIKFGGNTIDPEVIENDLDSGVVHYPTTSNPGQNGNSAYFGHSSNNIFNKGEYKFAFVLLHQLVPGDTFYITKDRKVYAYKVFSKTIVEPSEVGVLNPVEGHQATATLITCDPPGTSLRRLVVVGDQISPEVSGNTAPTEVNLNAAGDSDTLTGNGPTLWGRFISTTHGKVISVVIGLIAIMLFFRLTAPKPQR